MRKRRCRHRARRRWWAERVSGRIQAYRGVAPPRSKKLDATACRLNFHTAPEIYAVEEGTYALRVEDEGEPGSFCRVVL